MDIGVLVLRVVVGLALAAHGAQKLFGWFDGPGLERTGTSMGALGFRYGRLSALLAGLTECVGGVLLAAGLVTPLAGAMVMGVMLVAAITVHLPKGFMLNKGGYEYNLVLMAAGFGLVATGPGDLSLDGAFGWELGGDGWAFAALGLAVVGAGIQLLAWKRPVPVPAPVVTAS